jgi:hypothetical protein
MVFHCVLIGSGFCESLGTVPEPNRTSPEHYLWNCIKVKKVRLVA